MSDSGSEISVPVNLSNPGQFFACCGLLELADRLWPGAEGWVTTGEVESTFQISTASSAAKVSRLLALAKSLDFDNGDKGKHASDDDEEGEVFAIVVRSPITLVLDWWSDKSIKPWAGSMKERKILAAMLGAIDPENADPFNDAKVAFDPAPTPEPGKRAKTGEKREPFYFDYRRGCNAHPLDSGFSPDTQDMKAQCFPAVEALCFIGLQRARPAPTGVPNQSLLQRMDDTAPRQRYCARGVRPGSDSRFTRLYIRQLFSNRSEKTQELLPRHTRKEQRCLRSRSRLISLTNS